MSDLPPGFFEEENNHNREGDDLPPGFFENDGVTDGSNDLQQQQNRAQQEKFASKSREWIQQNNRRFKQRANFNKAARAATDSDRIVPPEFLRKSFRDHGDLSDPKFQELKRVYIGQLRFLPLAIHKLLENVPMPWEAAKYVDVLYHISGALAVIDDSPLVCEPVFVAQWATAWEEMRRYKAKNTPFPGLTELTFPEFAPDWVLDLDPKPPIRLDFDGNNNNNNNNGDDDDNNSNKKNTHQSASTSSTAFQNGEEYKTLLEDWFYEPAGANDPRSRRVGSIDPKRHSQWRLSTQTLSALQRLGSPLLSQHGNIDKNPNYYYLWNQADFKNAKILHISLPGAPKFKQHHPLNRRTATGASASSSHGSNNNNNNANNSDSDDDANLEDITDFNDPAKRIVRGKMLKETQLAFPFLYGQKRVEHCIVTHYHSCDDIGGGLRLDDLNPSVPPLYFNAGFHPIKAVRNAPVVDVADLRQQDGGNDQDFDDNELPPLFSPLLSEDDNLKSNNNIPSLLETCLSSTSVVTSNEKISAKQQEKQLRLRQEIKASMTLLSAAGTAFSQASGPFRRAEDVHIGESWARERAPRPCTRETGDPYAYLLRRDVIRQFQSEKQHKMERAKRIKAQEERSEWKQQQQQRQTQTQNDNNDGNDNEDAADAAGSSPSSPPTTATADAQHKIRRLGTLAQSKYYQRTRIEWLEAGMMLVRQAHTMIRLLLSFRNLLQFIEVGKNFTLEMRQVPSTKVRKKTRLGKTVLFLCEQLRLVKTVVDVHVKYRMKEIDAFQLADALSQIFGHTENISAMYREKLSVRRQAIEAKHWLTLVESRFNRGLLLDKSQQELPSTDNKNNYNYHNNNNNNSGAIVDGELNNNGSGVGFWHPMWKIWVLLFRGMTPLLEGHMDNLLTRLFTGRRSKGLAKRTTKQRVESEFDVNQVADFRLEVQQMLPAGINAENISRKLLAHLGEAWRAWKQNVPWVGRKLGMPEEYCRLIEKYVKRKADRYILVAKYNRERICRGIIRDKAVYEKNLQQLTRLKLKDEQGRQLRYKAEGPKIVPNEMGDIIGLFSDWLSKRDFKKIRFPSASGNMEQEIFTVMLQRVRQQSNLQNVHRMTSTEKEYQLKIEQSMDRPHEAINRLIDQLRRKRIFKPVDQAFADIYNSLSPVYIQDSEERLLDNFLDAYLWFIAHEEGLFPNWCKPADSEPAPVLAYKLCNGLNNFPGFWDTTSNESVVVLQAKLEDLYDNVDWHLMDALLRRVMDPDLVSYIRSRHDVEIKFKDMKHTHHVGLIRGFPFSTFLAQVWGLVVDLMLLGPRRASEIAGANPIHPNPLFTFSSDAAATSHPIAAYIRYHDRVTIAVKYDRIQADDLIERFLAAEPTPENSSVYGYKNKKCWPREHRMKLTSRDVSLGRAVLWDFRSRLPPGVCSMTWDSSFASVYSADNPNLLFDLAGFEIRILPACRTNGGEVQVTESSWPLRHHATREITAVAHIQVTQEHVEYIKNRLRNGLISLGHAPFEKIAKRWNSLVTELVPYYRESVLGTHGLQEIFTKCEFDFQNRIKAELNTRKPERFPPCIFYAPLELGGLGMVSIGGSMIPVSDISATAGAGGAGASAGGAAFFVKGLATGSTDDQKIELPNVFRVFPSWAREFADSARAWQEWRRRKEAARSANRKINAADVEDLRDLGIPRIHTNFSPNRQMYRYDRGWRMRQEWQIFARGQNPRTWWYHPEKDGRLEGRLDEYRNIMLQALGGAEKILEHSLFKATGIQTWDALYFDSGNSFAETRAKTKGVTDHQKTGLTRLPNQRFALWWSPTINRKSVYGGRPKQIERTGVMLRGKLAAIDTALRKIFRQDLWQKIHESLCSSIASSLKNGRDSIGAREVVRKDVPPRKSWHTESSLADIVLSCASRGWKLSSPTSLSLENDRFDLPERFPRFYIDVQIRWGDYDAHDPQRSARELFDFYKSQNIYGEDCGTDKGALVVIDLAYGTFSAYGYWFPGLKPLLRDILRKEVNGNPAMTALRTQVKLALEIRVSDPNEQTLNNTNLTELFSDNQRTWIIDDSQMAPVARTLTSDGNYKNRSLNGALMIVEPKSGKLYLSIVHKSIYEGQKRRAQLAREKAAEQVAAWLTTIPPDERPHRIVCLLPNFMSTLNSALFEFPNISIHKSELALPTPKLLQHDRLGELVRNSTESKTKIFNCYDDWLMSMQPSECFMRLVLILRCSSVAPERIRKILWPDKSVHTAMEHFWPTLSPQEWVSVMNQARDIILVDFATINRIQVTDLKKDEQWCIILGQKLKTVDIEKQEVEQIEAAEKVTVAKEIETKMINRAGEEITIKTKKIYSTKANERGNLADSRIDMARGAKLLRELSSNIFLFDATGLAPKAKNPLQIIMLKSQLKKFMQIIDTRVSVLAYLYGRRIDTATAIAADQPLDGGVPATTWFVDSIVIPVQKGNTIGVVATPSELPDTCARIDKNVYDLIAILRTHCDGVPLPLESDLAFAARLIRSNPRLDPMSAGVAGAKLREKKLVSNDSNSRNNQPQSSLPSAFAHHGVNYIIAGIDLGGISLHCCNLTSDAIVRGLQRVDRQWGSSNEVPPAEQKFYSSFDLKIVQRAGDELQALSASFAKQPDQKKMIHTGAFFVPKPGSWNYFFKEESDWPEHYALEMEVPAPFFDTTYHRSGEFIDFASQVQAANADDDYDVAE